MVVFFWRFACFFFSNLFAGQNLWKPRWLWMLEKLKDFVVLQLSGIQPSRARSQVSLPLWLLRNERLLISIASFRGDPSFACALPVLSLQRSESDVSVWITGKMLDLRDSALLDPGSPIVVSYPGELGLLVTGRVGWAMVVIQVWFFWKGSGATPVAGMTSAEQSDCLRIVNLDRSLLSGYWLNLSVSRLYLIVVDGIWWSVVVLRLPFLGLENGLAWTVRVLLSQPVWLKAQAISCSKSHFCDLFAVGEFVCWFVLCCVSVSIPATVLSSCWCVLLLHSLSKLSGQGWAAMVTKRREEFVDPG